jgi:CBS-domain-containing membrane protein/PII-like signaling protein
MDDGILGTAKRVCIYVNERDLHRHQPIHAAILTLLRKEGAAGASVFRGIEGFGGSGIIHTSSLVDLGARLPILIEWIDRADVVERLLPPIKAMVKRGLITVDDTTVELYCAPPVRDVSAALRVADVMSREVVAVTADTPARQVVELMLGKIYRAIPVVDAGKPIGIITNTDLLRRGGLTMPMQLLKELDTAELHAELERLSHGAKDAAGVMSGGLVTIAAATPLTEAAALMSSRRRKRLPVVDAHGVLVGMLSRLDVLRSAARVFEPKEGQPHALGLAVDAPIQRIMRTDVPMVFPEAHIPEIVQAVASTRLSRCLVVDHDRHPLGKITDAEVLERVTPALRPSALRALIHRLPFVHPKPDELAAEQHATAHTAADLMIATATVAEDAPIRAAIAAMLGGQRKIIAVVDAGGRLVGVVDRADLLHGLVALDETAG